VRHAVLFDATRLVDQALEDAAHGVAIERLGRLAAQAIEHVPLPIGIVYGKVIFTLELTNGEDDLHAFCDELQDTDIQLVDAFA